MKIVTLMENTACREGIAAEHGLSLYIETEAHKILFDAGQSGAFADNAEVLGVDLGAVDFAILSHGHYDHGGGLMRFLQCNDHAPIYVNRYAFEPHGNAAGKDIGLDPSLLQSSRIVFADSRLQIAEGITLCTLPVPPSDTSGLTVLENGIPMPEDFRHEQYLLIQEQNKKICFSGCSHKGIGNIVRHFHPDILVGGFHFMKIQDTGYLAEAAQSLLEYPTTYYTCHCTGEAQYAILKNTMGECLHYLSTGTILEI